MSAATPAAGWYSDPLGRYPWRYWMGSRWSQWVSTGMTPFEDKLPVGSVSEELAHIAFAEHVVEDLRRRHRINQRAFQEILGELNRRRWASTEVGLYQAPSWLSDQRPGARGAPTQPPARPRVEQAPLRKPAQRPAPDRALPTVARGRTRPYPNAAPLPDQYLATVRPPVAPRPARQARVIPALRAGWAKLRKRLVSDLAVYGLAYLGVLLLFTGVFGLMAFSMSEVRRDLRPVAEAAVPIATFASAWLLGRRGRQLVPKTLVLLGGLLLPVVLLASFVDGAGFPPDPKGSALVAVLTTASLLIAGAYTLVARRWRDSPICFLVAPAVWLAVAMAGLATHPTIPHAEGITRPVPWQMATVAAAIAVSLLVSRRLPALSRNAVEWSAVPAAVLSLLLTTLAANARDWPAGPLVVAGAATLVTIELLAHLVKPQVVAVAQAVLATAVLVACLPDWSLTWVGAAGVISFVVLAEWQGWRRPGTVGTVATLGGAAGWLAVASWRPWTAVVSYAVLSAWAHIRRRLPARWLPVPGWVTVAAAVLPAGVVGGLMAELPAGQVTVGVACAVAAISLIVPWLRPDGFWRWWIPAAAAINLSLAVATRVSASDAAIGAGLSAVAFASAPAWSWLRTWGAAAGAAASMAYALAAFSTTSTTRVVVFAVTGLVVVAGGAVRVLSRGGHLGLIGHIVGVGALAATAYPPVRGAFFPALAAFTGGWLVTTVIDETTGSPSVELAASVARKAVQRVALAERAVSAFPRVMTVVSLPALAVTAADRWGLVAARDPGSAVVVAALALTYVLAGRWLLADRLGGLLTPAGFGFAVLAVLASRSEAVAAISIGAAIATVAVMDPALRRAPYGWCAWTLSAPLAVLLARQAGIAGSHWYPVLIVWGAVLAVVTLGWDDLRSGRRNPGEWVRTRWMRAPALVAAASLLGGTAAEFSTTASTYGWWSLAVGAVTVLVAWQLRQGFVSLVSWTLFTVGYVTLAPWDPVTRPWSVALAGMVLAGLAVPLRKAVVPTVGRWWQRWDLPALLAGFGLAVLALGTTSRYDSVAATFSIAGGLAVGMWIWRRDVLWLYLADPLFVAASSDTNQGWAALVLFAIGVETSWLAIRAQRPQRAVLQLVSPATLAAGAALLSIWLDVSRNQGVMVAGVAGGVGVLCTGVAVRRTVASFEWAAPWAGLALLALVWASASLFSGSAGRTGPGGAAAGGLVATSVGLALAARPLRWSWLREGSAAVVAAAGAAALYSASPPGWVTVVATTAAGLAVASMASFSHTVAVQRPWTRPLILLAAISTAGAAGVSGLAHPGPGSVSLVSMAATAELMLAAFSTRGWIRLALNAAAAAALAGSLVDVGIWLELSKDQGVATAALAGGAVIASASVAVRWARMPFEWAASFTATAAIALALAASACFAGIASHYRPGLAVALGFALATVGASLAARPLSQPWLREGSAVLAAASGSALLFALQPSPGELVAVTSGAGLTATVLTTVAHRIAPSSAWTRPLAIFGSAATAGALGVAGYALPRRDLLAAALLAAGAQTAVIGFVFKQLGALVLSPVILCASWFTFATESLSGNPQWYTVPVGLTLIVIDELERDHFRRVGHRPTPPVIALEYIAMAFIVGSALAQQIATSLVYGILALGLGLLLALWGLGTHVRRRLFFGAGTVTGSILLTIAVPTAASAPGWHGPGLWVAVSLLGLVAMAIAAGIEQGHARLHHFLVHLGQSLRGWE